MRTLGRRITLAFNFPQMSRHCSVFRKRQPKLRVQSGKIQRIAYKRVSVTFNFSFYTSPIQFLKNGYMYLIVFWSWFPDGTDTNYPHYTWERRSDFFMRPSLGWQYRATTFTLFLPRCIIDYRYVAPACNVFFYVTDRYFFMYLDAKVWNSDRTTMPKFVAQWINDCRSPG